MSSIAYIRTAALFAGERYWRTAKVEGRARSFAALKVGSPQELFLNRGEAFKNIFTEEGRRLLQKTLAKLVFYHDRRKKDWNGFLSMPKVAYLSGNFIDLTSIDI